MEDILHKIINHKRKELESVDFGNIEEQAKSCTRPTISMAQAIKTSTQRGIIAEFKRRSPSKGWINENARVEDIILGYEEAGAAACSVLTNTEFFGGTIEDLRKARSLTSTLPLLRKEFIVDERQIFEARTAGADAILLIASCLTKEECLHLARTAHSVSLEVLLEVHSIDELEYVNEYIDMLGINNRNLGSFVTDVKISHNIAALLPKNSNLPLISESGIEFSDTIHELQTAGFSGFLIGETFMKTSNPSQTLKTLIEELC